MSEFDQIRNRIEQEVAAKYPGDSDTPGYRAVRHGEWTPGAPGHDSAAGPLPALRIPVYGKDRSTRTQLVLSDGGEEKTYWVDAPLARAENGIACAVLVGDIVELFEVPHKMGVMQVCLTLPEKDICVPHKTGTLLTLIEIAERRKF